MKGEDKHVDQLRDKKDNPSQYRSHKPLEKQTNIYDDEDYVNKRQLQPMSTVVALLWCVSEMSFQSKLAEHPRNDQLGW